VQEITMTRLSLPEPIADYFNADRRGGGAVARCFTTQAIVKDEGRTYSGLEAIRAWKTAASAKYAYTGNFPGSPVDLQYIFRLERGKIANLEIAP
jgi:hypothetical protein